MKQLRSLLVPLLLFPALYAERRADQTLEEVIRQFGDSLQYQTSDDDWVVVNNSPEEGFLAGTDSGAGQTLLVFCDFLANSTAPPFCG